MSSAKDRPEEANEEQQKITETPTPAPPPKLKERPMNSGAYLLWTYGFLVTVFLLLFFFSNQTIFNSEYGTTIGTYDDADLSYKVDGQEIIHRNVRRYSYNYSSNNRTKSSGGTRLFIQVINYKKDNPKEYVLSFAVGGVLAKPSGGTFHNCLLLSIIILSIINFLFYRWAKTGAFKRWVERRLYAAQLEREARQANRKSGKS